MWEAVFHIAHLNYAPSWHLQAGKVKERVMEPSEMTKNATLTGL